MKWAFDLVNFFPMFNEVELRSVACVTKMPLRKTLLTLILTVLPRKERHAGKREDDNFHEILMVSIRACRYKPCYAFSKKISFLLNLFFIIQFSKIHSIFLQKYSFKVGLHMNMQKQIL